MTKQLTLGLSVGILFAVGLCLTTPTAFSRSAPPSGGGDVRTPISSLPFTISSCGSYYLTGCLTGVGGQHGINVTADDVTIDLNGFTLIGVAGSLDGIHSSGKRVKVHGGFVRSWSGDGIESTGSANHFENIVARGNVGSGIICGLRSVVRRCMGLFNETHGLVVGGATVIDRCIAAENTVDGIHVDGSSGIATHNISGRNDVGIAMTSGIGWVFKENATAQNVRHGIQVAQDNLVVGNVSTSNGTTGIGAGVQPGTGCYVDGNVLAFNDYGVNAPMNQPTPDVVTRNCAVGNTAANYTGFAGDDFGPVGSAAASTSSWSNISQ